MIHPSQVAEAVAAKATTTLMGPETSQEEHRFNITRTANELGLQRRTLYLKPTKWGNSSGKTRKKRCYAILIRKTGEQPILRSLAGVCWPEMAFTAIEEHRID